MWMKTFRLVSLEVVENDELKKIALVDGLMINKEDEHSNWLIEVFTISSDLAYFEKNLKSHSEFNIRVVISSQENDPVYFQTKVRTINKLGTKVSIMLEGKIKKISVRNYAVSLLRDLLDQGLSGDQLHNEFKDKLQSTPF
jgi:hypothetical protein